MQIIELHFAQTARSSYLNILVERIIFVPVQMAADRESSASGSSSAESASGESQQSTEEEKKKKEEKNWTFT